MLQQLSNQVSGADIETREHQRQRSPALEEDAGCSKQAHIVVSRTQCLAVGDGSRAREGRGQRHRDGGAMTGGSCGRGRRVALACLHQRGGGGGSLPTGGGRWCREKEEDGGQRKEIRKREKAKI